MAWQSPEDKFHDAILEALEQIALYRIAQRNGDSPAAVEARERLARKATAKLYAILEGSITTNARRDA
jgi:hypothetical protein